MALTMNPRADAVESVIKAARKWVTDPGHSQEKTERIVRANNFHGRAVTIVSFSTDEQ